MLRRLSAVLLGLIFIIVVLEALLRLCGFITSRRAVFSDYKQESNVYRILCIGDSFTYGLGAAHNLDYPAQLEILLNSAYADKKFKVINRGRCSYNTAQILSDLKMVLQEGAKPDLVVFLGGRSNYWNFDGTQGCWRGQKMAWPQKLFYSSRIGRLAGSLSWEFKERVNRQRTLKNIPAFIRWRGLDSKAYVEAGVALAECGRYKEAERCFLDGIKAAPEKGDGYARMGGLYVSLGRYEEALKWLEHAMKIDPGNVRCYIEMGWFYLQQRRYSEAIECYRKGLDISPDAGICYLSIGVAYARESRYDEALAWLEKGIAVDRMNAGLYRCLAGVYRNKGEFAKAREYILQAARLDPRDMRTWSDLLLIFGDSLSSQEGGSILRVLAEHNISLPRSVIEFLKNESAVERLRQCVISDIGEIISYCRLNKIKIILMDYPRDAEFSELMLRVAQANSAPFLSNHRVFSGLEGKSAEYFVMDGHCSPKGYAVMARNLFDFLKLQGIDYQ